MSAVRTSTSVADAPSTPALRVRGSSAAVWVAVLLGLAGVAWWWTVRETHAMSSMVEGIAQMGIAMRFTSTVWTFAAMWVAMMAAMMVPAVLPGVAGASVRFDDADRRPLAALAFGAAYLGAWAAAGLVPLMVLSWWRPVNPAAWIDRVGGAAVVTAGLYQASPWKLSHLRVCRDPVAVGRTPREGVIAGLSYARCCLGCCWALMTVLFVIGLMDLAWLVAVSAALLVERNWRDGPRLARLVGLATVGLGLAVLVHPSVLTTVASVHHPTMMSAPVPQWA